MNERASGILLHPTSLFNRFPIGDLGPAATAFVDFLVKGGQRWWQMLPIGPTGWSDSPYQSTSAFAGNPLLLSPDRLMEKGFLDRLDIQFSPLSDLGMVDYAAAIKLKLGLLKKAFECFKKNTNRPGRQEFDSFVDVEQDWLEDFSLFSAIREKERTSDWTRWGQEIRTRRPEALVRVKKDLADDILYHKFVQWQFSTQWNELRSYCISKGLALIGDIPLFVAFQSADVWAHPGLFKLGEDGSPAVVAGVPPDYFSKTGQVWGVPVYNWVELQKQNYGWWIERLRTAFGRFDLNRLDHFIGFVRTYEVPAHAKTAEEGRYQLGGGAFFLKSAREVFGPLPLIAEDLGIITTEVAALRDQFKLPGTRVLQFELEPNLNNDSFRVEQHPENSVVYTGTHDNDTTAGWYRMLPVSQRETLRKRLAVNEKDVVWGMIHEAFASNAKTAIIPMQDILELGSEARMNYPGTAEGNWGWRLKEGELTPELAQRILNLTEVTGRLVGWVSRLAKRPSDDDRTTGIAKSAQELYERHGCGKGQGNEDWFGAEREMNKRGAAMTPSPSLPKDPHK